MRFLALCFTTLALMSITDHAFAQCYSTCPPGYSPGGSCCRTWYYDEHGNRICTSYGSYCYRDSNTNCSQPCPPSQCNDNCAPSARKDVCGPWSSPCNDFSNPYCVCRKYQDCVRWNGSTYRNWEGNNCRTSMCHNTEYCRGVSSQCADSGCTPCALSTCEMQQQCVVHCSPKQRRIRRSCR